ncbi:MAG: HAMP domain-containing histidine kinase, partial [Phycisphaerae bacterium]|nr:HAMP domain-containing histidine kinase [Phycisphaerae bacterium]
VHDGGEGIPAAQLSRVLEPFYTTKPRGNGLGLSICRAIIWQCRGRIELRSPRVDRERSPGDGARPGTSVLVEIPCRVGSAE